MKKRPGDSLGTRELGAELVLHYRKAWLKGYPNRVKSLDEEGPAARPFKKPRTVALPIELVEAIGINLLGKVAWADANNKARQKKAESLTAIYQALANPIWDRQPKLSRSAVAEIIVRERARGEKSDTVRRMIKRP